MHKDKKLKSQRTLITQGFFFLDVDDGFSFPQFLDFESLTNFPKFLAITLFFLSSQNYPQKLSPQYKKFPSKKMLMRMTSGQLQFFLLCIIKIKTLICITRK
jgi:hypothetical protein